MSKFFSSLHILHTGSGGSGWSDWGGFNTLGSGVWMAQWLLVSSGEIRASLISFNASSQVGTVFAASAALASSQLLLFFSPCPLPRVSLGTSSLSLSPSPSALWQLSLPCCHCRRRSARRRGHWGERRGSGQRRRKGHL